MHSQTSMTSLEILRCGGTAESVGMWYQTLLRKITARERLSHLDMNKSTG